MSTKASLLMSPAGFKATKLYSVVPNTGVGDFTVTRNTACDRIDKLGASTEVAAHVPRLDYRKEYVVPADNSFYSFDGTLGVCAISHLVGSGDFSISIKITTDDLVNNQFLIFGLTNCFGISIQSSTGKMLGTKAFVGNLPNESNTALSADTQYTLGYTKIGTVGTYYLNGIADGTTVDSFNYSVATTTIGRVGQSSKNYNNLRFDNRGLSSSEMLDIHNGVSIVENYIGANNFNFTAGAFTINKSFKILIVGTTDFTAIGASANTIGVEFIATGVGTGTGTATSIGNTLDLSIGKTTGFWYDRDHDAISTVTSTTLFSSTFSSDAHGLDVCPVLLTEPAFTNHFLNSRVPVTQTVTGLSVGTIYTINAKGTGIITVDETGGNGIGGTVTEVFPLTYTATATSVVLTLVSGEAFDWVQLSDTEYPVNHVETAGSSLTKAKDQVTGAGVAGTFDSLSGVLEVEFSALFDTGINRAISVSDGTNNNRVVIFLLSATNKIGFDVVSGGSTVYTHSETILDTTVSGIYKLKWANANFGAKINGVEVDSQSSGSVFSANTLTTCQLDEGNGTDELHAGTKSIKVYKGIESY